LRYHRENIDLAETPASEGAVAESIPIPQSGLFGGCDFASGIAKEKLPL
jgi:hypothetical protein